MGSGVVVLGGVIEATRPLVMHEDPKNTYSLRCGSLLLV